MPTVAVPDGQLSPYRGVWTHQEAAHLLGRAQFGFSVAELDRAAQEGSTETIQRLLTRQPETDEFQRAESALRKTALATGDINDLKIWWLYRMWASANPLAEKVALFWHNHFATSNEKVRSVSQMLDQNELIRDEGLKDFKSLLHGMSRNTAMLVWLDGNANRKRHPNENFAREIMELFALGVGNYSEKDIQEAARAFSGWHVRDGSFWFNELQHDGTSKTVFGKSGNFDGAAIVDLCLSHSACPRFLAMKLLKTFLCSEPSALQIDAVATRIRLHDYQMSAVLQEFLSSQMFFDNSYRRSVIKSPLDLVVGSLRSLATTVKWPVISKLIANLGQDVFEPPSVKGWEGGRLWINSSTVLLRANFATDLATTDHVGLLSQGILDMASETADGLVTRLDSLLLGGRCDLELRSRLIAHHEGLSGSPLEKLKSTLQLVLSLPEYQLQ